MGLIIPGCTRMRSLPNDYQTSVEAFFVETTEDKYIFGLFDSFNILEGMIEALRHYPDEQTW